MPTTKLILAILVSIGLVLSPVAAANAMASAPAGLMDDVGQATSPSTDEPCPCCDMASKCIAAVCTTTCAQLAPPGSVVEVALVGHALLTAMVPTVRQGLGWQPPTPPPRA